MTKKRKNILFMLLLKYRKPHFFPQHSILSGIVIFIMHSLHMAFL